MQHINRRNFLTSTGIALTALAMPPTLRAASAPHVVVVGGGFGGATVAKYLRPGGEGIARSREGARSGRQSTDCHHPWRQAHAAIRSSGAGTGRRFFTAASG